jgi:hypothetical protein
MSGGRSFRSLFMVASCGGAVLGCYLVSLRVASERAALESVETRIVLAQRDLRVLQTEIGTRGRLAQLERWNAGAFALSAPSADQFVNGSFELAKLTQPQNKVDFQAPVVLASAPAPSPQKAPVGQPETDDSGAPAVVAPQNLIHEASLKTETREVPARPIGTMPTSPKSMEKPVTAAVPAQLKAMDRPGLAAAHRNLQIASAAVAKKPVDKLVLGAAKPVTKPVRLAKTDPLAPVTDKHSARSRDSTAER